MHSIGERLTRINDKRIDGESLFLFMLVITLISSFLINSTFAQYIPVKVFNRVNYVAMFVLILKIYVLDRYNWQKLLVITLLLLLAVYSWRKTSYTTLMIMLTYILASKNVEFNKIIKYYFNTNLILIIGVSIYAVAGIIRNLSYSRNGTIRYSLGIDYPTDYAAYIFYLILAYSFIHYKKLNVKNYITFALIALLLNLITNARLDVVLILLVIPVLIISKHAEKHSNRFIKFLAANYWSMTLILPYIYLLLNIYFDSQNQLFIKLNNTLSGRLWYGHVALEKYPITLFGQKIYEHGWGGVQGLKLFQQAQERYFFIDSSFIRLLVIYGVILTAIVIGIMLILSLNGTLEHSYLMPSIILLVTISSLIDQHLLELTYNPFFLMLFTVLSQNRVRRNYES